MIDSDMTFGTFTMYCDEKGCSHSEEFDTDGNWQEMIQDAKRSGWIMEKVGNDWHHRCQNHED